MLFLEGILLTKEKTKVDYIEKQFKNSNNINEEIRAKMENYLIDILKKIWFWGWIIFKF